MPVKDENRRARVRWLMEKPGRGFFYQVVDVITGDIVCQTDSEANARHIAAAPQLVEAVKAMQGACDEWAAEFTQKTRAMNWGKVNDAYMQATAALRAVEEVMP